VDVDVDLTVTASRAKPTSPTGISTLQTLDRGLNLLSELAAAPEGLTVSELAARLGVHRTIASRLASTLGAHHMVLRGADGRYRLGLRLLELSLHVLPRLSDVALPELRRLAETLEVTAFLSVADGEDCVAIAVVEPARADVHVAYRVGSRHSLNRGAPGIAILAGRPARADEDKEVSQARRVGYSFTSGHLQPGAVGVAAPVPDTTVSASVGVVDFAELPRRRAGEQVIAAAERIGATLRARGSQ
jgi:DNA-binding IclR family transcriptional regulator